MRRRIKASAVSPIESDEEGSLFVPDEEEESPTSTKNDRLKKMIAISNEFKSFRPASEVLTRVRSVRTIFPQFDHATRVGGLPIERFTLIHGPSGQGKTKYTIGILKSFLMQDHFSVLIDAERTTSITWLESAMGEYAHHPYFKAARPKTYEATVLEVRNFLNTLKKLRDAKKLPATTSAVIVVDSIRKLVPENIFKKITEAARTEQDGKMKDRSGQIKAAMNAAWMDEVIPLLEETGTAMVVIARESEDPDADPRSRMFGTAYKVGGGTALYYDASMDIRVERAKYITKSNGEDARPIVYGERHRVTIKKSKVAGREDKTTVCHFHSSNGVLIPEGFDRARDVLELARQFNIVQGTTWLKWGQKKWQGEHLAVKKLTESPETLDKLEAAVRLRFDNINPVEYDEDGVVAE